jgi:hypothetical protein
MRKVLEKNFIIQLIKLLWPKSKEASIGVDSGWGVASKRSSIGWRAHLLITKQLAMEWQG